MQLRTYVDNTGIILITQGEITSNATPPPINDHHSNSPHHYALAYKQTNTHCRGANLVMRPSQDGSKRQKKNTFNEFKKIKTIRESKDMLISKSPTRTAIALANVRLNNCPVPSQRVWVNKCMAGPLYCSTKHK